MGESFLDGRVVLHPGNCLDVLAQLEECSIDSCVTDPPYHLTSIVQRFANEKPWDVEANFVARKTDRQGGSPYERAARGFMGKQWDGGDIAFDPATWRAVYRVLKPGAHLIAMGGTRTYHRLACAIEDAGFEIRDTISWLYGSGFPKSHDVSKKLDVQERNKWLNVCKAVDNLDCTPILRVWIEYSNSATSAGLRFQKSETEIGTSTQKSDFVRAPVLLRINPENSYANAIIAELNSRGVPPTSEEYWRSVLSSADDHSMASSVLVNIAVISQEDREATQSTQDSFVPNDAQDSRGANISHMDRAVEALMIWLGSKPFLKSVDTIALCAALTDDLKHIILNQSESFRSLDTLSKTDCVSATTVIITESTAASLISFTADILKNKGIDRAAGAEREVVGRYSHPRDGYQWHDGTADGTFTSAHTNPGRLISAPATDAARQWEGWGTALKPACELIVLARKPLSEGTVAANVLRWGTGAINVDGCRVAGQAQPFGNGTARSAGIMGASEPRGAWESTATGRWPANLAHDGSDEVTAAFPDGGAQGQVNRQSPHESNSRGDFSGLEKEFPFYGDTGSAARFFYTAKADADDRLGSKHPTVKPLDLMQWLVRLVCPKGGTVFDPFAGTGTTGEAAWREGMRAVLIEAEPEYQADIRRRMALVLAGPDERTRESIKAKNLPVDYGPLFGFPEAAE